MHKKHCTKEKKLQASMIDSNMCKTFHVRSLGEFLKYFYLILKVEADAFHCSSNLGSNAVCVSSLLDISCTFHLDILCKKNPMTQKKRSFRHQ